MGSTGESAWFTLCFSHSGDAQDKKKVVLLLGGLCHFAACPLIDTLPDFWCCQAEFAYVRFKSSHMEGRTTDQHGLMQQKP